MLSKWFIVCMIASSILVYLTVIGRGIYHDAPASLAWILPLGPNAWEQATKRMVPHGTPLAEVISKLGQPDDISEPHVGGNIQHLIYANPHDSRRLIVVTIGPDGKVISTSYGSGESR